MALDYARAMADELGEPTALEQGAWDRNPIIPLVAVSPDQGAAILRNAEPIRRVVADPAARACHFLLAMERRESTTFGYEQNGEVLRKDVLQTAVSFENHRVLAAARTGQEVREHFVEHVLCYLAGLAPAVLEQSETARAGFVEAQELAWHEARTVELQLRQEEPGSEAWKKMQATLEQFREQAAELDSSLEALPLQPAGDVDFLGLVREVLLRPGDHLPWRRVTLLVRDFGVLVREEDGASGRKVSFLECAPPNEPAYALFFARLGRDMAARIWPDLGPEA